MENTSQASLNGASNASIVSLFPSLRMPWQQQMCSTFASGENTFADWSTHAQQASLNGASNAWSVKPLNQFYFQLYECLGNSKTGSTFAPGENTFADWSTHAQQASLNGASNAWILNPTSGSISIHPLAYRRNRLCHPRNPPRLQSLFDMKRGFS